MHLRLSRYPSELCELLLVTDRQGVLRALEFGNHLPRVHRLLQAHYDSYTLADGPAPPGVINALDAYFSGELAALDDVPTATGGTAFQRRVWKALRTIPPGSTASYRQIAARIGQPSASRAVGAANGANPIVIVVPCHRVISADGGLGGYGGGLGRKRWLLAHEKSLTEGMGRRARSKMVTLTP